MTKISIRNFCNHTLEFVLKDHKLLVQKVCFKPVVLNVWLLATNKQKKNTQVLMPPK